jgi:hypothetical protein
MLRAYECEGWSRDYGLAEWAFAYGVLLGTGIGMGLGGMYMVVGRFMKGSLRMICIMGKVGGFLDGDKWIGEYIWSNGNSYSGTWHRG